MKRVFWLSMAGVVFLSASAFAQTGGQPGKKRKLSPKQELELRERRLALKERELELKFKQQMHQFKLKKLKKGFHHGYKSEKYAIAMDVGEELFEFVQAQGSEIGYTACDSETCRWQLEHGTTIPSRHPIEIVAHAYGLYDMAQRTLLERPSANSIGTIEFPAHGAAESRKPQAKREESDR